MSLKINFYLFFFNLAIVFFFVFLASQVSAQELEFKMKDIIYSDSYVRRDCVEWVNKVVIATTTKATTTEQECQTYTWNEYVKVGYKEKMSEFADNEIPSKRTSHSQTFDLGRGEYKHKMYLRAHYIKSGNTWYDIREKEITKQEYDSLMGYTMIPYAIAQSTSTIDGSKDTAIMEDQPTTNFGGGTYLQCRSSAGGNNRRSIFSFDMPSLNGTISDVNVFLYFYSVANGGGMQVDVHELSQAYVESEATWNVYSTGNNWASAGGDYVASSTVSTIIPTTTIAFYNFSLIADADNPMTIDWGDSVDLLFKANSENGGGEYVSMRTTEYTTEAQRPYIEIYYTVSATAEIIDTLRIDEFYCVATTSGNVVLTRCQAPIVIWVVIGFFLMFSVAILFKYRLL